VPTSKHISQAQQFLHAALEEVLSKDKRAPAKPAPQQDTIVTEEPPPAPSTEPVYPSDGILLTQLYRDAVASPVP